ncbi:hypothetical protein QQ045_017096 [Rhodiola kirilowii]
MPHVVHASLFLLLILHAVEQGNGSRGIHEEVASRPVRTAEHYPVNRFMDSLPRGSPATASAPSRKHNQIGFQERQSP